MDGVNLSADLVGRVIDGRYPLLRWLGGSDGSGVFLTELDGPGSERVAIKIVAASYASAQAQLARWSEAAKLSHPHLMKLLRSGRDQIDTMGIVYSVTECADEVLADILKERALKPDEVKELLIPVLDVLFYLHGRGYVHGHLKPSNILVVRNQLLLSGDGLQVAGEPGKWFRGLTAYDAPETGDEMMSAAEDVWSLGMLLVAALTQGPLEWDRYGGKEPKVPEGIPQPFGRMSRECLRLEPKRRCTLVDLNKARFEQVHPESGTTERRWAVAEGSSDAAIKRRGRKVIMAGIVVAVLLAIFGMEFFGGHSGSGPAQKPVGAVGFEMGRPSVAAKQKAQARRETQKPAASQNAVGTTGSAVVSAPQESAQALSASPASTPPMPTTAGSGATVQRVMPEAPQSALHTIHGTVRVRIAMAVDASGKVTDATFVDAGPSKYFARLAMAAAQKWRFAPGAAGKRVVEFDFRQTGVEVAPPLGT